jgi:hypothetical protein
MDCQRTCCSLSLSYTVTFGVRFPYPEVLSHILTPLVALESQVFTTNMPSTFFTLFGNPGGIVAAELAQDRFEEDVKLMSKSVSYIHSHSIPLCTSIAELSAAL